VDIHNHVLENGDIDFRESPNHSGIMTTGEPDTIVIHYTAGGSAESSINTLCDPERKASAHLVVAGNGEITQLVPFDTIAWHAGKSSYGGRSSFNNFSVGIEIDNAGRLTRAESGYVSWFGRSYPEEKVIRATHRNETEPTFWHQYTEEQINAVFDICSVLRQAYPITHIVGHEEIAPSRKTDPGPAFPLDKLRDRLLVLDRVEDGADEEVQTPGKTGVVNASRLNIRSDPWSSANTIAPPLNNGTTLDILEESDDWYYVDVQTRGWVSKKYVDLL